MDLNKVRFPEFQPPIIEPPKTILQKVAAYSPQVKQALIGAGVTVVLAGITLWIQHSSYSQENGRLKQDIVKRDGQIVDLTRQKDKAEAKAHEDENALAPWVQLASSQFTNTPMTKRLDKLFDAVTASINVSTSLQASVSIQTPSLLITVSNANRLCWTSGDQTITAFKDYFPLSITVKNTSEVAVGRVMVEVQTTVDETNTFAKGWEREYPGSGRITFSDVPPGGLTNQIAKGPNTEIEPNVSMNHWITGSAYPMGSRNSFLAPTIYFTNTFQESTSYAMFPVWINVFTDRSKTYGGMILLISPRKGGEFRVENGMIVVN